MILMVIFSCILVCCGAVSHAQEPAAPAPALEADVSPDELQRLEKKRALEAALPKIRESYLKGDFQEVLKGVAEAEKIDPANGSVRFYKEMAKMRLSSGDTLVPRTRVRPRETGEDARAKSNVPGASQTNEASDLPSLPGSTSAEPSADSGQSAATSTPAATTSRTDAAPDQGFLQRMLSSKWLRYGGLALVLAVAAAGIFVKVRNRKQSPAMEEEEEEEEEDDDLSEPEGIQPTMGLHGAFGLSGLPRRPDDDTIVDADDIAQQMAGYTPSEQPPSFDIFSSPSDEEVFTGPTDNVPTLVEDGGEGENHGTLPQPQFEPSRPAPAEEVQPPVMFEPPTFAPPTSAKGSGAAHSGETVSFDDLGIFLSDDPKPAPPEKPAVAEPPRQTADAGNPVSPGEMFSKKPAGPQKNWNVDSISLSDSSAKPAPPAASPMEPIKLESFAQQQSKAPENKTAAAPTPEKPPNTIDLEDLLFGDLEATLGSTSPTAAESTPKSAAAPAPAPSAAPPPALSGFEGSWNKPTPEPTRAIDATATAFSETIHSQDTVQISPSGGEAPAARGIEAYKHPNDALDATVGMGDKKPQESAYGSPAKAAGGTQLDERSEKMFREQFDRAMKAFGEKNWKQAVHYLSIAAAIHPENSDVREKLREAREQKRNHEAEA